jgi:hypothetical protein
VSPFLDTVSPGTVDCSMVDTSLPEDEHLDGMGKPNQTWEDILAGDPSPGYTLNSASRKDATRPPRPTPINVSDDEENPDSQQQVPLALQQISQPNDECTSQEEDLAELVHIQGGDRSDGTPLSEVCTGIRMYTTATTQMMISNQKKAYDVGGLWIRNLLSPRRGR